MKAVFAVAAFAALFVGAQAGPVKACPAKSSWGHDAAPAKPADNGGKDNGGHDNGNNDNGEIKGAVCPADNGKTLKSEGSCGCSFEINCDVKATPGAGSLFWQKDEGKLISTLAECNEICNENDKCENTLWVDEEGSAEYHLCWQVSGLGPVTGEGIARISYKTSCDGGCDESYSKEG